MDLQPANFGRIAAFYNIKYQTIDVFASQLENEIFLNKKLKGLIEVLAQSAEFEQIPIRQKEEGMMRQLVNYLTYPIDLEEGQKYNSPSVKVNMLLQCHFNRIPLNIDMRIDQKDILKHSVKLIHAMVDVISSYGYLKPALLTMELCQMCVQAMWVTQSPLLQLPGFDGDLVDQFKSHKVEDIVDFMNMDDDLREKILDMSGNEIEKLAQVCTRYPNVEIDFQPDKNAYQSGDTAEVEVAIRRSGIEDDKELQIFESPPFAQYFPGVKEEQWWVVIGQPSVNSLVSIKKITSFRAQAEINAKLQFVVKNDGNQGKSVDYMLYLICDSYIGCDQETKFSLEIA